MGEKLCKAVFVVTAEDEVFMSVTARIDVENRYAGDWPEAKDEIRMIAYGQPCVRFAIKRCTLGAKVELTATFAAERARDELVQKIKCDYLVPAALCVQDALERHGLKIGEPEDARLVPASVLANWIERAEKSCDYACDEQEYVLGIVEEWVAQQGDTLSCFDLEQTPDDPNTELAYLTSALDGACMPIWTTLQRCFEKVDAGNADYDQVCDELVCVCEEQSGRFGAGANVAYAAGLLMQALYLERARGATYNECCFVRKVLDDLTERNLGWSF